MYTSINRPSMLFTRQAWVLPGVRDRVIDLQRHCLHETNHLTASSRLVNARVTNASPAADWFIIGGVPPPSAKRKTKRFTPAWFYRLEMFFTRHGREA